MEVLILFLRWPRSWVFVSKVKLKLSEAVHGWHYQFFAHVTLYMDREGSSRTGSNIALARLDRGLLPDGEKTALGHGLLTLFCNTTP